MLKILNIALGSFNHIFCTYIFGILVWCSDDGCRSNRNMSVHINIW